MKKCSIGDQYIFNKIYSLVAYAFPKILLFNLDVCYVIFGMDKYARGNVSVQSQISCFIPVFIKPNLGFIIY